MKTAVYDSPRTCCREAWRDGKLVASISESLMYAKGFNGWPGMPFMLNCGRKFEPGKVRGDIEAIPQDQRPPVGFDAQTEPGNTAGSRPPSTCSGDPL